MSKNRSETWYDKTPKPASKTQEGKERERAYYAALGRFVHMFARVEFIMALTLRHYAKTPDAIARAVFSGVRVKEASAFIGRLAEVTNASADARAELKDIFDHLAPINSARNDLLHYGAISVAEGNATVTNAVRALDDTKITSFPVSPEILAAMTADLIKISMHLHSYHAGRQPPRGAVALEILRAAWRYKHQPQPGLSREKEAKSPQIRRRIPKRARPPPSSQA